MTDPKLENGSEFKPKYPPGKHPNSVEAFKKFKKFGEYTPEEAAEMHRKSVETQKRKREERKRASELLELILSKKLTQEKATAILGHEAQDLSKYGVMLEKVADKVLKEGDVKAMEFIRDTVGDKPESNVNVNANVITEKDRELLDMFFYGNNNSADEEKDSE